MATVLNFPTRSVDLKTYRKESRLSLSQAVCALRGNLEVEISTFALESWENGRNPGIEPEQARRAYQKYRQQLIDARMQGKNVLFGALPIRTARDVLGMSIAQIAESQKYSANYWTKVEANSRIAPDHVIKDLEARLKDRFATLCAS